MRFHLGRAGLERLDVAENQLVGLLLVGQRVRNPVVDAAFVVAGAPTVAVSTLASTHKVRLVSIDDEHIENLIAVSPYYTPYTIKSSVYGTDEDCQTVAVGAVVIANNTVSEDAVYDFVSTVFNDKAEIAKSHDKGNELDLAFASSITNVPYHPGAAKYFAEQGIEVPTN